MEIYESPKSAIDQEERGGFGIWLWIFWTINLIWLTFFPLIVILAAFLYLVDPETDLISLDSLFLSLELLPDFIFSLWVLLIVRKRDERIPNLVKKIIGYELLTKFIVGLMLVYANVKGLVSEPPNSIFLSMAYYFIWSSYFKRSKVVLKFYGKNAD